MKKIKLAATFIFLSLIMLHSTAKGQLSIQEVDALMQNALTKFNVAGAAIAIVKDGKVVCEKGYGVRSVTTNLPVDVHTNFQIASNSKAFTTAALSILVDEGKISWKDKVRTYIPEFKMYNDYVTENFLIEDLLCHRSGLGLGIGDLMSFPDGADFTIKDVLTNFQYFKPTSPFRTHFDYDNQLYIVAGELIKRVTGMSWEEFVKTRIFEPLQMSNSYTSLASITDKTNVATPHSTENKVNSKLKTIPWFADMINGAAGGILSNVDDMSKWVITQLNKGKYGNNPEKQLFTEARQKEMWSIHTVLESNPDPRYNNHFSGYGLGWGLSDRKGCMVASHTGGLPGMLSIVYLIPDLKLGIIILTNSENGSFLFSAVSKTIVDSYLGLDKIDWIEKFSNNLQFQSNKSDSVVTRIWEIVNQSKNAKIAKKDYIGIYEDKWFGKVEVFEKGDRLWFKSYRSPKLNGEMFYYKANTFAIKWEYQDMNCDAFAIFSLDEEGEAKSIKMKGISPSIDFSFDFHDLDLQRVQE